MQCPNCQSQVPNTANVCGYCGANLSSAPANSAMPGWIFGLLGGLGGLILLIVLGGVAYYFLFRSPSPGNPAQPQVVTVVVVPTEPEPAPIEEPAQPPPQPIPTDTSPPPPPPQPAPVEDAQYCETFEAIDYSIVYLDWISGAPLTFYVKMPGGVPGLEKKISGVSDEWRYKVTIGNYKTEICDVIQGYKERLYCSIELPSGYSNSIRPIEVVASSCDTAIYEQQIGYLPTIEDPGGGGGGGGGGGSSCGDAPPGGPGGCTGEYMTWCSCMGGQFVCGFGGPICLLP